MTETIKPGTPSFKQLNGQTALISGGSTELAGALALELAQNGVRTCLCGKNLDLLELSAQQVRAAGGECYSIVSELESLESAQSVLEQTLQACGRLDMLLMVSPFFGGGLIHSHSLKTWDLVLNANLREAFILSRTILPLFRQQKHGQIMAVGSDSSLGHYSLDGAYSVAMHGLNSLMELIRIENSDSGIRVHTLAPGLALNDPFDMNGNPNLTTQDVSQWALWLLSRPGHLRANGPILI